MRIKTWLGHQSLATTQIYLSDEMDGTEQASVDKAFAA
jgi:site-specific recombinase XerC